MNIKLNSGILVSLNLFIAIVLGTLGSVSAGEVSVSELINEAAVKFEEKQSKDFKPVQDSLERWRKSQINTAVRDLSGLLSKAAPADQPYIAYHLLSVSPKHRSARDTFTKLGIPAPFDEMGIRVSGATIPVSRNRELVERVSQLRYPPFSAVAQVVSPKSSIVASYWKRQQAALDKLRDELVGYAQKGQADNAFQVLAYYWPGANEVAAYYASQRKEIPRQRTWFTSVDRYLLDHGLAGIDCLDERVFKPTIGSSPSNGTNGASFYSEASWDFMENLRNCRIEGIFTTQGNSTFSILDSTGNGAELVVSKNTVELFSVEGSRHKSLAKGKVEEDLSGFSFPVQMEVRGRYVAAMVGGVQVCTGNLSKEYAFRRMTIKPNGLVAQQMRVRYLAEVDDTVELLAMVPKKAEPPPVEPWVAEREKQLARLVTFKFEDTSVDEVVALLTQLSGMPIIMDEKAETLKNLPVTLDGKDLKLSSALDWLKRVSDLSWKTTEKGVTLTWSK